MGTDGNLSDLHNLLFRQIEKLGNDELKEEQLEMEVRRAKAVGGVATRYTGQGGVD